MKPWYRHSSLPAFVTVMLCLFAFTLQVHASDFSSGELSQGQATKIAMSFEMYWKLVSNVAVILGLCGLALTYLFFPGYMKHAMVILAIGAFGEVVARFFFKMGGGSDWWLMSNIGHDATMALSTYVPHMFPVLG